MKHWRNYTLCLLLVVALATAQSGCSSRIWSPSDSASSEFVCSSGVSTTFSDSTDLNTGFGGGSFTNTLWDGVNQWVTVNPATGGFPDNGSSTGWLNMSGNVLLMHLDDVAGIDGDCRHFWKRE